MREWNATFRIHHMPPWFKKLIRARYKRRTNGGSCWNCYEFNELQGELWDHWGSVDRGPYRSVITQPYSNEIIQAKKWAYELGCNVIAKDTKGGPWNTNVWLYEFIP
jgi:hypothetical protein